MGEFIKVIVLGLIQGLTEFLPVSSSGHLLVARKLLGLSDAGILLDTMLHFGTLIAVIIVFWQDIYYMIRRPFSRLSLLIIAGTIPTAVIGVFFKDFFEDIARTGIAAGWCFLATGLILWFVDGLKDKGNKNIEGISFKDALVVGALQGVAILPAVSRSGLTIAGSLFQGMNRKTAARFSFLLSTPAILGAFVLQGKDLLDGKIEFISMSSLAVGVFAAALSGYFAIRFMLNVIQRGSLKIFSYYVWTLGAIVLAAQFLGKF